MHLTSSRRMRHNPQLSVSMRKDVFTSPALVSRPDRAVFRLGRNVLPQSTDPVPPGDLRRHHKELKAVSSVVSSFLPRKTWSRRQSATPWDDRTTGRPGRMGLKGDQGYKGRHGDNWR